MLFGPLVILLLFSFNDSNILAFPLEGFTTHWYTDALHDTLLRESLLNSTVVAFVVAPRLPRARHAHRVRAHAVPVPGPRRGRPGSWARR